MTFNLPLGNRRVSLWIKCCVLSSGVLCSLLLQARNKGAQENYGLGLTVTVPAPESEVLQAVEDVVADGIIQGSKEYNKDEYISGAEEADKTDVFPNWSGPGRVFYKVRKNALDPRNFKDSVDSGTLAVRYVVQHSDDKNTVLKIDAVFVDDLHLRPHASNGSVEGAEYAAIQDHLATMHLQKQQAAQEEDRQRQELAARELAESHKQQLEQAAVAQKPDETLEQHVANLRHQVERLVRAPGAQLKTAPFRSASSVRSLSAGAQVLIVISTPYWYGVETENGERGWIHRSQLEPLP